VITLKVQIGRRIFEAEHETEKDMANALMMLAKLVARAGVEGAWESMERVALRNGGTRAGDGVVWQGGEIGGGA
jgi:hypothetical protein